MKVFTNYYFFIFVMLKITVKLSLSNLFFVEYIKFHDDEKGKNIQISQHKKKNINI